MIVAYQKGIVFLNRLAQVKASKQLGFAVYQTAGSGGTAWNSSPANGELSC
jgi:hypothetical protein